jgi:hypothetical protein
MISNTAPAKVPKCTPQASGMPKLTKTMSNTKNPAIDKNMGDAFWYGLMATYTIKIVMTNVTKKKT